MGQLSVGFGPGEVRADQLRMLRELGVSELTTSNGGFIVKFFPMGPPVVTEPLPNIAGEPMCRCRHPLSEHGAHGLCLQGCAEDVCLAPEEV